MDKELMQELEILNENLKAVVSDFTLIYCKIDHIEQQLQLTPIDKES